MDNSKATGEMKPVTPNVFYKQCDEPGQPQRQASIEQKRHNDDVDDDPDSDSDGDPYHFDGDAVIPELIKLTLAQHRMILSLSDVTKEAELQLRITNARLDLVEEELSLMRSSLAEQPANSLFSGVRSTRQSLDGTERDRANDYILQFDLTDIGATLAAGPGPWEDFSGHTRHHVCDRSPSPRPFRQRRRSPRPEREEHVKRTRISYDGLGGQDPKICTSTSILSTPVPRSTTTMPDETSKPSLLGKLRGKMARLLFGS